MSYPIVNLSEICEINIGSTPARNIKDFWGKGYPWLSIADMNQGKIIEKTKEEITDVAIKKSRCHLVKKGTVLFSFKLSIGKTGIANKDLYTNEAIASLPIINKKYLCEEFLFYALQRINIDSIHTDRAVMGATLNKKKLSELKIPLPPLPEQRRIAAILDKADALRRKRAETIKLLDQFLRSVFLEMFGDPVRNEKGWKQKTLEEIVAPEKIVTYGIVQAGPNIVNGVPYIKTGDIKDGQILVNQLARTSHEIAKSYERSKVKTGDIVISIRATVGTTAIVPKEIDGANLTQGTARISPGPGLETHFLYWLINNASIQHWIQRQVKGATFREITLAKLRQLPVILPPLEIQYDFQKIAKKNIELFSFQNNFLITNNDLFCSASQRAFRGELQ